METHLAHLIPQRKHDPIILTLIGHPRMPRPQIPQHDITFLSNRLNRRSGFPPFFDDIGEDIAFWFSYAELGVREYGGWRGKDLVATCGGCVRAKPEFGGAGGPVEGAERNVGDYVEWALDGVSTEEAYEWQWELGGGETYLRVEESNVFMNWLAETVGIWKGVVSCHKSPAWICSKISDDVPVRVHRNSKVGVVGEDNVRVHELNDEGIEEYVVVKVLGMLQRRSLKDICC